MKKLLFIFTFALVLNGGVFGQNENRPNAPASTPTQQRTLPADFRSDDCSLFPDCDYADCCREHDRAYFFGGSRKARRQADARLFRCVGAKRGWHHRIIAPVMWLGVRLGGVSWLPTPFRWGFGADWEKKREKRLKKLRKNALPPPPKQTETAGGA